VAHAAAYVCFAFGDAGGGVNGGAAVVGAFHSGDDGEVCAFDAAGANGGGGGVRLKRFLPPKIRPFLSEILECFYSGQKNMYFSPAQSPIRG